MATRHALTIKAQPDQDITTEGFSETEAFANFVGRFYIRLDRAIRQSPQHLLDQRQTLLDLLDADPDSGIDIAVVARRHLEEELVIGRIAKRLARVEGATAGASHVAASAELAGVIGAQNAGLRGAVLQRGGVVVEPDEPREYAPHFGQQG